MLSVSDEYLQAINADVRNMPYRVTLAGAVVLDQTRVPRMTFDEGLSDNSGISLGTANSATLKLTLREPEMMDYSGMYIEPESGLTLPNGNVVWIPLGKFWVTGSSTNNDYKTVQLTCADGMYHLTGDYISNLTFPVSPQDMMYEIVAQTGIKFVEPESWPDIKIKKKPQDLKLNYRTAIGYIAGCCGKNARFNREGALEFVWYKDIGKTIERKNQYLDGMIRLNDKPLQIKFEVTGEKETFTVTTISDTNGSVIASPNAGVTEGERVNVTVQPLYEYELATITAVTDSGEEIVLVGNAERTEYYFNQPEDNVTITASFRKISGGPYELSVSSQGNGEITYSVSTNEKGENFFNEGDTVNIFVTPESGYIVDTFVTTPSTITLEYVGKAQAGKLNYRFTMPRSDVSIAARFKTDDKYSIERTVGSGTGYIIVENTTVPGAEYHAGDVISVRFARSAGYVFSRYESNISMVQVDSDYFKFVMPSHDVSITAYFVEESDTSKDGTYSLPKRAASVPNSDTIVIDSSNITAYSSGDTIVISGSGISASADGDTIILTIDSTPDDPIPAEKVTMTYTNPFINEKMVSAISSRVKSISYTPAKVKHRGNPAFQAGDIVTVPDREGNYHNVLIIQQTMTFGGGMNTEISCPGQTQKTKNFSANSSSNTKMQEAVYKSNAELERKIKADNALIFSALNKSIVAVSQQASSWGAQIESLVEWRGATNKTMAAIQQTASANSANISLLVENNAVKGSVVIEAINKESVAKISADRLDIVGKKLNIKVDATNIEGTLNADKINANGLTIGKWIVSGETLRSSTGDVFICGDGSYSVIQNPNKTTIWDLLGTDIPAEAGKGLVFRVGQKNEAVFGIGIDGALYATNAYISGTVKATTGNIGDLLIENGGLFSAEDADTFAGLKPGLIGINTPDAWFNADKDGVSAGVNRATGSGANAMQIGSAKCELRGDWYFVDSTGREISLATIITLLL